MTYLFLINLLEKLTELNRTIRKYKIIDIFSKCSRIKWKKLVE
jgi:hypothetical protein